MGGHTASGLGFLVQKPRGPYSSYEDFNFRSFFPIPSLKVFLVLVHLLLMLTQAFSSFADDGESKENLGPNGRFVEVDLNAVGFPIRPQGA